MWVGTSAGMSILQKAITVTLLTIFIELYLEIIPVNYMMKTAYLRISWGRNNFTEIPIFLQTQTVNNTIQLLVEFKSCKNGGNTLKIT